MSYIKTAFRSKTRFLTNLGQTTVSSPDILEKNVTFDVRKSVHHHTIHINQPTRCNSFTSLLLNVYVWLNMFRALSRPASGAYNCISSLWFYRWSVAIKPEAANAVVSSWWWARKRPETCWATHKRQV